MEINTLIIGYVPITDTAGKKPRDLRDDNYFKKLLSKYDLGNIYYSNQTESNWKAKIDEVNPLIIIYLGGEHYAQEVKKYKDDALMYLADDAGSIFYRKAEAEEKKEKHKRIFSEIERIVEKIKSDGEKEIEGIRKFSAMSYNDMYKMLQKAIISEDEDLKKKAWDLLFGEGEKHKDFIWMRVQMMAEIWEHAKGDALEQLMLMSMERHIDQGTARKMDNFKDENGLEYHQYMFLDPFEKDTNHIRRLPFATKGQDKYGYENLLEKNEIPTNYLRVQVEANSLRKQYDDYLECEYKKVEKILEEWEKDKTKGKKELGIGTWNDQDDPNEPLKETEVEWLRNFLKKYSNKNSRQVLDKTP